MESAGEEEREVKERGYRCEGEVREWGKRITGREGKRDKRGKRG